MAHLYQISEDIKAVDDLFNSAVDENGEPRELTEEEQNFLQDCFKCSQEDFENKFDSYGKYMANLKLQSDNADAERKNFKAELDRLSSRAKVFENRRTSLKNYLFYAMQNLKMDSYKSSLFSAKVQQTPVSIKTEGDVGNLPERFLKPREVNTSAIKECLKSGTIKQLDDGSLVYNGELLEGIKAERGTILVIR